MKLRQEYSLFADTHLEAPHAKLSIKDFYKDRAYYNKRCILLGDIYDVSNCLKKDLYEVRVKVENLMRYFGKQYIQGNHECMKPTRYYFVQDEILFCHGHTLFWDDKKVKRWENKRGGRSAFKYFLYRFKHIREREGKTLKLKLSQQAMMQEKAKEFGCHTIVFGHTHKSCDIIFRGIRIVGVPRGNTVIEL